MRVAIDLESTQFLRYALKQQRPDEDLFLSDVIPVAATAPTAAAAAFYHILALATKGLLKVDQEEPFGEVSRSNFEVFCSFADLLTLL